MRRYRVDIFDRSFGFVSMGQTSEPTLVTDYLVQTSSQFTMTGKVAVSRGCYAQVRGEDSDLYQGIVTDYMYNGNTTTITLAQMSKLLDVEVFADITTLSAGIEAWMSDRLREVYAGTDTAQALSGLVINATTTTAGMYEPNDDGVYNLYDIAVQMFKSYGVIIDIRLDIPNRSVVFSFRVVDPVSVWLLETNLADVADYTVSSATLSEFPNKMVIRRDDDPSQELVFYWHPHGFDGYVDTDGTHDRVLPVVSRCATVSVDEDEVFADVAYEEALSTMYQSQYDDQIEITFNSSSKLVEVGRVGQLYLIKDGSEMYATILTGYQRINDRYTRMTFGYVRTRLTQILSQERRRK